MSLAQFKVIYYWEWTHRLLARATGAVFLLPFLLFLWQGAIPPPLRPRLWIIFAGGAALGVVGWWMVASGLANSTLTKVSQYRLAFHMTLACAIYAAVLWTAQQIAPKSSDGAPQRLRLAALAIAALLLMQIYLGALVAGLDGGLKYNTWPLIDGAVMPPLDQLIFIRPLWRNLFENILTVQFNHRMLADGIWLLAMLHAVDAWRTRRDVRRSNYPSGRGDAAGRARHHYAVVSRRRFRSRSRTRWRRWWYSRLQSRMPNGLSHRAIVRGAASGGGTGGMIDVKNDAGIDVLTLMHGKANALDIEFCEALTARFVELRKSDAEAVVLTGQGRIFSAGVDLIRLSEGGADYVRKFLPALHKLYDAVFNHPKPVVAAINGHAIAGGCVLACCADRRVMARDGGRIGVTELLVGVPFPALAFEIMRLRDAAVLFSAGRS